MLLKVSRNSLKFSSTGSLLGASSSKYLLEKRYHRPRIVCHMQIRSACVETLLPALKYHSFLLHSTHKMSRVLSPRESAKHIAREAKSITILEQGVKALVKEVAKSLQDGTLTISRFSEKEVHPKQTDEMAIMWLFVVDTLNFCFWPVEDKKWTVTWRGKKYSGYYALCACINRAIDDGYQMRDPAYYSKVSLNDLKKIFMGDDNVVIPQLVERQKCLHEVGEVLLEKFGGSFVNCLRDCNNSAEKLLRTIVDNFECYRDEGVFENVRVSFYKRAQILIGDIWACFQGKGFGYFKDISVLTMFPDYRIPQVLVHFNSMRYSDPLMHHLRKDQILINGSREEMEIRGCSIHIVELVMEELKILLPNIKENLDDMTSDSDILCNPVLIDHFLWDYRKQHADELEYIPFHKTPSIYY